MDAASPPRRSAADAMTASRTRPRPVRSRARRTLAVAARSAVLLGLIALTAWNFTRSDRLEEALTAEARGDDPTALKLALAHHDRRPWSAAADRLAARCLSRLDFAERAEPYYRRARGLDHADRLHRAYGFTRANLRERAVEAYRELLTMVPGDVATLRLLGGVLLSQSRWPELVPVAEQLIATPPGPVVALTPQLTDEGHWRLKPLRLEAPRALGYTLLATAQSNLENPNSAAEAYLKVLELDPQLRTMPLPRAIFCKDLADVLLRSGRSADVIGIVEPLADELNNTSIYLILGQAHFTQSNFDDARRYWERASALDPTDPYAWRNLGRLELQTNRPAEAVKLLEKSLALRPTSYETNYSLGLAYRRLGKPAESQKYLDAAAAIRRKLPPAQGGMGAPPAKPS